MLDLVTNFGGFCFVMVLLDGDVYLSLITMALANIFID